MPKMTSGQRIKKALQSSGINYSENATINLIRIVGSPFITDSKLQVEDAEADGLFDLAVKNKISLLYLESLKKQGQLKKLMPQYSELSKKRENFLNALNRAAKILNGNQIQYAVFKTVRPYPEIPGDIDTLILGDEAMGQKAIDLFLKAGYKEAISDGPTPTSGDLMNPVENVPIDLQQELRLSWMTYMDKRKFVGKTIMTKLPNGGEVSVLKPELDMGAVIIHSAMEQLFLLGEYYTFLYRLADMTDESVNLFIDGLKEHKIIRAARCHLSISAVLCEAAFGGIPDKLTGILDRIGVDMSEIKCVIKNDFKVPHRYQLSTLLSIVSGKMKENKYRRSVFVQMYKMLNPKLTIFMVHGLIERRRRKYYIKDYVKNKIKFKP